MTTAGHPLAGLQLCDHAGGEVPLAEIVGTPALVLFLPGAFTPVCSSELPGIVQLARRAAQADVPALVITCDAPPVLAAWREAEGITLPLLSDFWPHGAVSRALDAFDTSTGRSTRTGLLLTADGAVHRRVDAPPGRGRDLGRLAEGLADL